MDTMISPKQGISPTVPELARILHDRAAEDDVDALLCNGCGEDARLGPLGDESGIARVAALVNHAMFEHMGRTDLMARRVETFENGTVLADTLDLQPLTQFEADKRGWTQHTRNEYIGQVRHFLLEGDLDAAASWARQLKVHTMRDPESGDLVFLEAVFELNIPLGARYRQIDRAPDTESTSTDPEKKAP